jgi:ubiquitin-protein ligase
MGLLQLHKAKFTCAHTRTRVDFPDGMDNMLRLIFYISIVDNAGPYANGDYTFHVEIPKSYPFQRPLVIALLNSERTTF